MPYVNGGVGGGQELQFTALEAGIHCQCESVRWEESFHTRWCCEKFFFFHSETA